MWVASAPSTGVRGMAARELQIHSPPEVAHKSLSRTEPKQAYHQRWRGRLTTMGSSRAAEPQQPTTSKRNQHRGPASRQHGGTPIHVKELPQDPDPCEDHHTWGENPFDTTEDIKAKIYPTRSYFPGTCPRHLPPMDARGPTNDQSLAGAAMGLLRPTVAWTCSIQS